MNEIELRLSPEGEKAADVGPRYQPERRQPIIGWCAVGCGVVGIFTMGYIFVPLGFLFSVIAFFVRQASWGFFGLLLNLIGLMTSPSLLVPLGLGFLYVWLGGTPP